MEKPKTAEEILATYHPISRDFDLKVDLWPDGTVLMFAKEYARQAIEAYLDEVMDKIADYLDAPDNTDDEMYQRGIKRGLTELKKINIDDYLK